MRLRPVGDLPVGTFVKCFGKRCVIESRYAGFSYLCTVNQYFRVPDSRLVLEVPYKK